MMMAGEEAPIEVDQDGLSPIENVGTAEMTLQGRGGETPEDVKDADETTDKKKVHMKVAADAPWSARMWEVFTTFWPLGLIAFGGPQVR